MVVVKGLAGKEERIKKIVGIKSVVLLEEKSEGKGSQ